MKRSLLGVEDTSASKKSFSTITLIVKVRITRWRFPENPVIFWFPIIWHLIHINNILLNLQFQTTKKPTLNPDILEEIFSNIADAQIDYYRYLTMTKRVEKFMLAGKESFKAALLYFKRVKKVEARRLEMWIVSLTKETVCPTGIFRLVLVSRWLLSKEGRLRFTAFLSMYSVETHFECYIRRYDPCQRFGPFWLPIRILWSFVRSVFSWR